MLINSANRFYPNMPFEDLREFLDFLDKEKELVRVNDPVDAKYEISAFIRKTCNTGGPAIYFENVRGYDYPVVGGISQNGSASLMRSMQTSKMLSKNSFKVSRIR